MKKFTALFIIVAATLIAMSSCNDLISMAGRKMDDKKDLEYAINLIKERMEKKKVIEVRIHGSGRELQNKMSNVFIFDLDDKNTVSQEMIGIEMNVNSYDPSSYYNSDSRKKSRGNPENFSAIDPVFLNADLLLQGIAKAKEIIVQEFPEYTFKVIDKYEITIEKDKTVCGFTLNVTKDEDAKYSKQYYYEVKFLLDKEGNVTLED